MTSAEQTVTDLILGQLDQQAKATAQRFDAQDKMLNRRLDAQDKQLTAIAEQATATNGRVTELELREARMGGFRAAFRWVEVVAATAAGAGATALVALLVH